jgi:hypothetical protein
MKSEAFARFRLSFFEDADSARQGLDTAALAQLAGEERTEAENMLIQYLPDARGVIGLGILRSQKAEAALLTLFENEQQMQRISKGLPDGEWQAFALTRLAKALSLIRPDRRWSDTIIDVLAFSSDALQRQSAAEALGDVSEATVLQALIAALDDPNALVRYHAGKMLLTGHGLSIDVEDVNSMLPRLMSQDAARRESGKRQLLAAIAGPSMASRISSSS